MRLLLLLFALFASAVYAGSVPDKIKCNTIAHVNDGGTESEYLKGVKDCRGACEVDVTKSPVAASLKNFELKCVDHSRSVDEKPNCFKIEMGYACKCFTDYCLNKDMKDFAYEEFAQTGKLTWESLNKPVPTQPPNPGNAALPENKGPEIFSLMSAVFVAVFCSLFAV